MARVLRLLRLKVAVGERCEACGAPKVAGKAADRVAAGCSGVLRRCDCKSCAREVEEGEMEGTASTPWIIAWRNLLSTLD